MRALLEEEFEANVTLEPVRFVEVADQVVVFLRYAMVGRHTGIEVEEEVVETVTFRDGKIARVAVSSKTETMEALARTDPGLGAS